MNLISCKNVDIGYTKPISKNINFEVEEGDYLCIIGENGAGKSTLIKTILRLKNPLKGSINFENGLKKNEIGYLPQQTIVQKDFPASVWEIILSGFVNKSIIRPWYSVSEVRKALKIMQRLEISHLRKRCYRELSGGQQQRVLLARALCATEKIILLDEPTTGLDQKITQELFNIIKKINEEDKVTVIMVIHDIRSAVKNAKHILHINAENSFWSSTENFLKSEIGKKLTC